MLQMNSSSSDPRFAFYFADVLQRWKNGLNANELAQHLSEMLGEPTTTIVYPPTAQTPELALCGTASYTVVLFLGAMDRHIIGAVTADYFSSREQRVPTGVHPLALATANALFPVVNGSLGGFKDRTVIAGYSWGGACAQALAMQVLRLRPNAIISVVTFGSPRVVDDRGPFAFRGLDLCRYMNEGDQVVVTPPAANRAPLMHALLQPFESEDLQQWQQCGAGKLLKADNTIVDAMVPWITTIYHDLRLANFLVNSQSPVAIEHRIDLYRDRLFEWMAANVPVQQQDNARVAAGEEIPRQHRRDQPNPELLIPGAPVGPEQDIELDPWVMPLPVAGALAVLPPRLAADGPSKPYEYLLDNGAHTVVTGDVGIAICTTKRQAKAMAKRLNLSWSSWNKAIVGDAETFAVMARENFID